MTFIIRRIGASLFRPEDVLDSKSISINQRERRSRYPPVTPNACAKDDIHHSAFEALWRMLADSIRILLQRYSEHFVITHPMAIAAPDEVESDGDHIKLPQIGSDSLIKPMGAAGHRVGLMSSRPSPHTSMTPVNNGSLNFILQISKMQMTEKNRSFM